MLPKVLLHDHLDGGLRPETVADLAQIAGYTGLSVSPKTSSEETNLTPTRETAIARYFEERATGSLAEYLEPFTHTLALMQTPAAIRRVALESVVDHSQNGVVYAELRMAPSLHLQRGLSRDEVIAATLEGLRLGEEASGLVARLIVCAMRHSDDALEVAMAAARFADQGVVGFDLAGPEAGFPAHRHRAALEAATASGLHLTIHAGEGDGLASIEDALDCGAERLGHGVRIIEDITVTGDQIQLGPIVDRVRSQGVALEICPKSEVDTRTVRSAVDHPIDVLDAAGLLTTVNTDNTLMSMTNMTNEFAFLTNHKGFTSEDFYRITMQSLDSAFCDDTTREQVRTAIVRGYDQLAPE